MTTTSITRHLVRDLCNAVLVHIGMETKEFHTAAIHRVSALLNAMEAGKYFLALRDIFKSVPNKKDSVIETDMGTFKGWKDFLAQNDFKYDAVNRYIFMYEHRQEFEELKLLSLDPEDIDSGASGHRKIAACDAVKWYLKLIEEQGDAVRNTVTAADYQKYKNEQQLKASPSVDNITLSLEEYFNLRAELTTLRQQVEYLMAELTIERSKQ